MTPRDINALTPLVDFPGYYIDLQQSEVWSYLKHGTMSEKKWNKLKPQQTDTDCPCVNIFEKRRPKRVTLARLIYSAEHGVSYYSLPKDVFILRWQEGHGVTIQDRNERMKQHWAERKEKLNGNRLQEIEHNIMCLGLLKNAYTGDATPLLDYVQKRRADFLRILTSSAYAISYDRAKLGYEMAYDNLLKNLEFTTSRVINFDGWFIKTMVSTLKQLYKKNRRYVDPDKVKNFW